MRLDLADGGAVIPMLLAHQHDHTETADGVMLRRGRSPSYPASPGGWMQVFVSWSGTRSRGIAKVLRNWLGTVMQSADFWMSDQDIEPGTRWADEVGTTLEASQFGILVVTRENLRSPWLMFEAGALSKSLGQSRVTPILFGVDLSELVGPLQQFQAFVFEKEKVRSLLHSVNAAVKERTVADSAIDDLFEMVWSSLEQQLVALEASESQETVSQPPRVSDRQVLEDLVVAVRNIEHELSRLPRTPRDGGGLAGLERILKVGAQRIPSLKPLLDDCRLSIALDGSLDRHRAKGLLEAVQGAMGEYVGTPENEILLDIESRLLGGMPRF